MASGRRSSRLRARRPGYDASVSQPRSRATEQVRTALVLACALVAVLPLSGSSVMTASELAAVSLVVLALAGALAAAPRFVTLLPTQLVGCPVPGDSGPPVLRTRTTDPTHQPLA